MTDDALTAAAPTQRRFPARVRREHVLDAALQIFAERGYRASMDEIAKATGVTRTVLYYYFPSKKDLFLAVHEAQVTEFLRRVAPAAARPGTVDERFRATLDSLLAFAESEPRGWDLVFAAVDDNDSEVAEIRMTTRRMIKTAAEAALTTDATRMGIDPQSTQADLFFDLAIAVMVGAVAWWRRHPDVDRATMLNSVADLLGPVIGAEPSPPT